MSEIYIRSLLSPRNVQPFAASVSRGATTRARGQWSSMVWCVFCATAMRPMMVRCRKSIAINLERPSGACERVTDRHEVLVSGRSLLCRSQAQSWTQSDLMSSELLVVVRVLEDDAVGAVVVLTCGMLIGLTPLALVLSTSEEVRRYAALLLRARSCVRSAVPRSASCSLGERWPWPRLWVTTAGRGSENLHTRACCNRVCSLISTSLRRRGVFRIRSVISPSRLRAVLPLTSGGSS